MPLRSEHDGGRRVEAGDASSPTTARPSVAPAATVRSMGTTFTRMELAALNAESKQEAEAFLAKRDEIEKRLKAVSKA